MPDPIEKIEHTSIHPLVHTETLDYRAEQFVIGTAADGKPVYSQAFIDARNVMGNLFTTSTALAEAERNVAAVKNDPAAVARLKRAADANLKAAAKSTSDILDSIAAHRAKVSGEIEESLGIPQVRSCLASAGRASDVRAFLRSLNKSERLEAVREAMANHDLEVCAAVLGASPIASGLKHKDVATIRLDAESRFAPRQAAMRDSLTELHDIVEQAGKHTYARFGPLTGNGDSPAARAENSLRALEGGAA